MKDPSDVEALLQRVKAGDPSAVEELCDSVRDDIYGLAMRMLGHPADAEDATQEILILIVTHLGSFEGRCSFRTWTWRVATNHLMKVKRGRRETVDFETLGKALDLQKTEPDTGYHPPAGEEAVLWREVKIGCSSAMLLALDREHRLAFILCEILELSGEDAAAILEVEHAAVRKRVSRARSQILAFMQSRCGWVDEKYPCRCAKQLPTVIRGGQLDPQHLLFATHPERKDASSPGAKAQRIEDARKLKEKVEELDRAIDVFRSHPNYGAPDTLRSKLQRLIRGGRFKILDS